VLHRLDYETSGVLLFGKFPRDREALQEIWKHPDTKKKYIALVKGKLRGDKIAIPLPARIYRHPVSQKGAENKIPAETRFRILKIFPGKPFPLSLVEAEIKTGRHHQIRRHFAAIGCPVLLDSKYGDQKLNRMFRLNFRLGRLFLHAASIEFFHPFLKKSVKIEASLPPDLQSVLKKLRFEG
jgi:23S rRNA pseudouridine955/2504/2580 synthase